MLVIREAQLEAFAAAHRAAFVQRMRGLFCIERPDLFANLANDEVDAAVQEGIDYALDCGLETEAYIERFLTALLAVGLTPAQMPSLEGALETLADEQLDPLDKLEIFEESVAALEQT